MKKGLKKNVKIVIPIIVLIGLGVIIALIVINPFKNRASSGNQSANNGSDASNFDSSDKQEILNKLVEICKTSKTEIEKANQCIESEANKLSLNVECETLRETRDYSNNEEKQETLNYLSELCTTTNLIIGLANDCVSENTNTYDCG